MTEVRSGCRVLLERSERLYKTEKTLREVRGVEIEGERVNKNNEGGGSMYRMQGEQQQQQQEQRGLKGGGAKETTKTTKTKASKERDRAYHREEVKDQRSRG